jgi:hypothetical protein
MTMGNELITIDPASLERVLTTLAEVEHERDLGEDAYPLVRQFADLPAPRPRLASDDDVRNVIGSLASTLKAARTSREQGAFQLGLYRKALTGYLSAEALAYAGDRALRTLTWMPTPAELIDLAKPYSSRAEHAHAKARFLCRERAHRLMEEALKRIAKAELTEEELNDLPERWLAIAETQGAILKRLNGSFAYRTRVAYEEDRQARIADYEAHLANGIAEYERSTLARADGFHDTRKAEGELKR